MLRAISMVYEDSFPGRLANSLWKKSSSWFWFDNLSPVVSCSSLEWEQGDWNQDVPDFLFGETRVPFSKNIPVWKSVSSFLEDLIGNKWLFSEEEARSICAHLPKWISLWETDSCLAKIACILRDLRVWEKGPLTREVLLKIITGK